MAILTSYEGSNDDYENGGTAGGRTQAFQVPSNSTVTSVSIYGSRGGSASGNTVFSIHQGTATGTTIATKTIASTSLSGYGSPAWNEITFDTPGSLVAGTTYHLKVLSTSGSSSDEVRWSTDTTSPAYASGHPWYGTGDASYVESTTRDKNFRVNGNVSTNTSSFFLVM